MSVCFIIDPTLLEAIVRNGEREIAEMALYTISRSEQIRERRNIIGSIPTSFPTGGRYRLERTIFDGRNEPGDQGTILVRREASPRTEDSVIDKAYDYLGMVYDFYFDKYDRNSIDDNGMRLDSIVHYDQNFANAFWSGNRMVYGDGLPNMFKPFAVSIDVTAHEFTHGITQCEVGFNNFGQPSALNEHFCDVFASMVKQLKEHQSADQADWLIGSGLFTSNVKGRALRDMANPGTAYDDPVLGKDPQPSHMKDFVETSRDNGGVHINSGIPNKAFCITAKEIGGNAWEQAGQIWYVTLTRQLTRTSDFQDCADSTFEVAGTLFGSDYREQRAVSKGWTSVGLTPKVREGREIFRRKYTR